MTFSLNISDYFILAVEIDRQEKKTHGSCNSTEALRHPGAICSSTDMVRQIPEQGHAGIDVSAYKHR